MHVPPAVLITMFCTVHPPLANTISAFEDTGSLYCSASRHNQVYYTQ